MPYMTKKCFYYFKEINSCRDLSFWLLEQPKKGSNNFIVESTIFLGSDGGTCISTGPKH